MLVELSDPLFSIVPIAAAAYVATNLDNLTLLVSLLVRYRGRTMFVSLGYLLSMLFLGVVAFWVGEAADKVPLQYLGLLGLIPVGLGLHGLWRLYKPKDESDSADEKQASTGWAILVATFFTQLGNGGDTIVTFGVVFADSMVNADPLIFATIATMASIFVLGAVWGVRHPALGNLVDRYGPKVTPVLMIIVGIYVLMNTATDITPG